MTRQRSARLCSLSVFQVPVGRREIPGHPANLLFWVDEELACRYLVTALLAGDFRQVDFQPHLLLEGTGEAKHPEPLPPARAECNLHESVLGRLAVHPMAASIEEEVGCFEQELRSLR